MVRGSCLCGGVTFEIDDGLTPIQMCHATRCRKATGAAASPEMLAPSAAVSWTRGRALVKEYEAPLLDAPPAYRRAFCSECGSSLAGTENGRVMSITLGTVEGDPGIEPESHIFVGSKAGWHDIGDQLPQFDEWPPDTWKPPSQSR